MICGIQSDEELRKVQKMGKKQGDDNIGKKPHTELGASEILTSNLRQAALEDCEAFPRCGDTREVNLASYRFLEGKRGKLLLEFSQYAKKFSCMFFFRGNNGNSRLPCVSGLEYEL